MKTIGTVFKFVAPNEWKQFQEGNKQIFLGPEQEELIVSASLIQGIGTTTEQNKIQKFLFENAEKSIKNTATHPALIVIQPFQREKRVINLECWSMLTQTHDGASIFYQVVYCDLRGVLLATFEAQNTVKSRTIFEQFIKSVAVSEY